MKRDAFFVDLPNFYSHLVKSKLCQPKILRDYFLYWLDFDVLAKSLAGSASNIWVFYSGGRIGPSDARVDGKHLDQYIDRINRLKGVTAHNVNIPGVQREAVKVICNHCGKETIGEWQSEKGIDASLTVHLFDTMDSWDNAFLLSGDADFVPVVSSLRRRGKIVVGAGFPNASSALVRECYDYIDLIKNFLSEDLALYLLFKEDGIIQNWFTDIKHVENNQTSNLELNLKWFPLKSGDYNISFKSDGFCDAEYWWKEVRSLPRHPLEITGSEAGDRYANLSVRLKPVFWKRVGPALRRIVASTKGMKQDDNDNFSQTKSDSYTVKYVFDGRENKYVLKSG